MEKLLIIICVVLLNSCSSLQSHYSTSENWSFESEISFYESKYLLLPGPRNSIYGQLKGAMYLDEYKKFMIEFSQESNFTGHIYYEIELQSGKYLFMFIRSDCSGSYFSRSDSKSFRAENCNDFSNFENLKFKWVPSLKAYTDGNFVGVILFQSGNVYRRNGKPNVNTYKQRKSEPQAKINAFINELNQK